MLRTATKNFKFSLTLTTIPYTGKAREETSLLLLIQHSLHFLDGIAFTPFNIGLDLAIVTIPKFFIQLTVIPKVNLRSRN